MLQIPSVNPWDEIEEAESAGCEMAVYIEKRYIKKIQTIKDFEGLINTPNQKFFFTTDGLLTASTQINNLHPRELLARSLSYSEIFVRTVI